MSVDSRETGDSPPMHVAFICHDLTSRFNTSLELADRLRRAGHRVTYVTHADVGSMVMAHGHDIRHLTGPAADPEPLSIPAPRHFLGSILRARRRRAATAADDELETAIEEVDPDIILIDIEMHYAAIVLCEGSRPVALYMNWFSVFRGQDIPPLDSSFIPSGSPDDARHIRRAWFRSRAAMWVRRVRRRLGRATVGDLLRPISLATYHHADLRAVARARGVHLGDLASRRHWLQPLTFTRVPILSFTAVEMEFPHAPRPTLRYVGPMIANQRIEPSTASPSVEKWQRYLADRESTGEGRRPIVYCSLGSYLTDVEFLRRVLGVFRERGEWHLVLGLGGMAAAQELGDVPDNATVLEWAPQLDVLSVADVAIIHGGSSSVHECIANAVPMLVYPPSRRDLDQHGNAARVEAAGLGIVGSWRSDGPTDIADRLDRLLSEESFRTRVRSMQEVFSTYGTHEVAVSTIARELRLHRSEAPGTEPPQGS